MKKLVLLLSIWVMTISAQTKVVAYSYLTTPGQTSVDFSKVDYLIGSFVFSDINGNLRFDSYNTSDDIVAVLKEGEALGALPMIALGTTVDGWNMTKDSVARTNFINNLLTWCDTNGVKGIDLDLEGTAEEFNWGSPGTFFPEPYELLATELRTAMPDSMLLTSAVGSHARNGAQWTDGFLAQLNWINVMIYDRYLSWEDSPVLNHSTWEAHEEAATYWHATRGLEKQRIIQGVPFYARAWDRDNNRIYTEDPGWTVTTWDYKYFIDRYPSASDQDTIDFPATDSIRYVRTTGVTGKGTLFYNSYDLIVRKTQWTIDSGYGGIMIWHVTGDVATTDSKSLLQAIDNTINGVTPIMQSNPESKLKKTSLKLHSNTLHFSDLHYNKPYDITLYTAQGRKIYQQKNLLSQSGNITLTVPMRSQGVYLAKITGKDLSKTFQIVK